MIDAGQQQTLGERIFFFNFGIFSFVMFSCLFPTGFSATFSTLAFVFALPLALKRMNRSATPIPIVVGLFLFGWLTLSILWSGVNVAEAVGYLLEYRLYFMVPIFVVALSMGPPDWQKWLLIAVMAGCAIALVMSFALAYGIVEIKGAKLSLANRVYHGFIMSVFYCVALLLFRHGKGWSRFLWAVLAGAAAFNVLFIEQGRTGYLQILGVTILLIFLSLRLRQACAAVAVVVAALFIGFSFVEEFRVNLTQTLHNIERMMLDNDHRSSSGYRIEFYRQALEIGFENPVLGVGVGGVVSELETRFADGRLRQYTDNVHSEYMNMLVAGGFPALMLFMAFVIAFGLCGLKWRHEEESWLGDAFLGICVIIAISALFNSTVKDYGEKHALLVLLPLLFSFAQRFEASRR